jgi:hypothetical protein
MPRSEFDSVTLSAGPSLKVAGRVTFDAGETVPAPAQMRVAWVVQQGTQDFTGGVSAVNRNCEWSGATSLIPSSWVEDPKLVVEATGTLIVDGAGPLAEADPDGPVHHDHAFVWTQVCNVSVEQG